MSVHILIIGTPGSGKSSLLQALETGSILRVDKSRRTITLLESDHTVDKFLKKSGYKSLSGSEASVAQRRVTYHIDSCSEDVSCVFFITSMLDWNLETVVDKYEEICREYPGVPVACLVNKCDVSKSLDDARREYLLGGLASLAALFDPLCVVSMSTMTGENLYFASLLVLGHSK